MILAFKTGKYNKIKVIMNKIFYKKLERQSLFVYSEKERFMENI